MKSKLILLLLMSTGLSLSLAHAEPAKKPKAKPLPKVKAVSKVEVAPINAITTPTYEFKMPERKTVQFKIQRLKSPESTTRGWSTAFSKPKDPNEEKLDVKIVTYPKKPESLALKDGAMIPLSVQEENKGELKPLHILTEQEERMLAAKILANKNKCYISIGLWKSLGRNDEALLCLVHDQYDDVAIMNLNDPKNEDSNTLLSRLSSLQIKRVDENLIKNSESLNAKIMLAYEQGHYQEVVEKTKLLDYTKENYKLFLLKVLSLSSLNKIDAALFEIEEIQKLASENDLTVLNVLKARMLMKMQKPEEAMAVLQQMPKEHPLWLESMQDLGWAQLQGQDFSGAIGNMYSLHTPYFRYVYQPQSYVIRTIGYLNLCQYGDAYRSLSEGEQKAHQWSTAMQKPVNLTPVVKNYIQNQSMAQNWPLPVEVLRELARHRTFINLQKEVNRLVASQGQFKTIEAKLTKLFTETQERASKNQKELKRIIADLKKAKELNRLAEAERLEHLYDFQQESYYARLFEYQLAKNSLNGFKAYLPTVEKNYSDLYAAYEKQIDYVLQKRFHEMQKELALVVDQNELLRYEVFAGSGEDIRYQAAGGEIEGTSGRLPASFKPSKSLQWTFDGEIWEDEIGHYRSSLINNCPKTERAMKAQPQGVEDDKT